MGQISNEEKDRLSKLGNEYNFKEKRRKQDYLKTLPKEVQSFLEPYRSSFFGNPIAVELIEALRKNPEYKPSEFVKTRLPQLFNGYLNPAHAEHIFYTIDHLHERIYYQGYYRRSMRSADPEIIALTVGGKLSYFGRYDHISDNLCDYLEGKTSDEIRGYYYYNYDSGMMLSDLIAKEIDDGNTRLIQIIQDSLSGESEVAIRRAFFAGIMKAHDKSLYELLGRLLVAAGLQEGLRQSICEEMDCGTTGAFTYLLQIIRDNNFIRFSAVKRSFAVWMGFGIDDASKLDRVFDKIADYTYECLTDQTKREEYLNSEDCLKIHVALWSLGFYEVNDLISKVQELINTGTRHQILTASYSLSLLNNSALAHRTVKPIIEKYHDDIEIMAAFMRFFISIVGRDITDDNNDATRFFDDKAQAQHYYDILKESYENFPGKKKTFDPFIFPWYSATIEKSDYVIRLAYLARILGKTELADEVCGMVPDADVNYRAYIIKGLCASPKTEIQRKTLTAALCDKSDYVRGEISRVIDENKVLLSADNYLQMEEMLRYKYADARQNLIKLLLEQDDDALEKTIIRLPADKKEEKRCAALDMILNISEDVDRKALFDKCAQRAKELDSPTTKEKILIDRINPGENDINPQGTEVLFTDKDQYVPEIPDDNYIRECVRTFMDYFPDSEIGKALYPQDYKEGFLDKLKSTLRGNNSNVAVETADNLKAFGDFIKLHENDEYDRRGETVLVGGDSSLWTTDEEGHNVIACRELWKGYFDANIESPQQFFRMYLMVEMPYKYDQITPASRFMADRIYGSKMLEPVGINYSGHANLIIKNLMKDYVPQADLQKLAIAVMAYYARVVKKEELYVKYYSNGRPFYNKTMSNAYIQLVLNNLDRMDRETVGITFPLVFANYLRAVDAYHEEDEASYYKAGRYFRNNYATYLRPEAKVTIFACYCGLITKEQMYSLLFDEHNLEDSLEFLTSAVSFIREKERQIASRRHYGSYRKSAIGRELANESDDKFLEFISEVYEKVIDQILTVELKRGDTPTIYSNYICKIERVYGVSTFVAVLAALGKETLERSSYYSSSSKKGALSRLLMVCIPDLTDDAKALGEKLRGTDISDKRLVEASLYAPEWISIVGEYLGWEGYISGCYYFTAHMNEYLDEKKKAIIARYTPLEPDQLRSGAFDVDWFKSVYKELGQDRFNVIYDAAKYISDGGKHSRARKYADAVLGKFEVKETEETISDKRNKDLLMAYPLIPLQGEDDICNRYLFLQQFLKESKKFGSQRSASEKTAVGIAMQNLSINAGYSDVMRLTLRMETKLVENMKILFEEKEVGDVAVKLLVDDCGNVSISVIKGGKTLKSVPAAIKKDEYIKTLTEAKKQLTDQYRRTRQMFEQSMEDRTFYSVEELDVLRTNPVVEPLIRNLVFVSEKDDKVGFLKGITLTDFAGEETKLKKKDNVRIAHSFDIYKDGHLADYQKLLFEKEIVQPFKQVFRELYVKTQEEMDMPDSRRYAGNQIQPQKTIALLKTRRWTPDIEDGIQKVYYKENIVATIYALADWFSPSDIEAPTLEFVAFYDRKTYKAIKIKDVPDIIFSEVMRDVDLAVSVAHAGGVDPETSHSTIEMRAAILEFTLPLFKLSNVTVEKSHAHIEGKYGNYTVHLGSGVVHKMGGTMINILPVHSQHRGKLFLPFADEDPKTAEVITKVLFLANDSKIKDPSILDQIK
ncbi:DUF4132 domain-containing protein [Butyrivibrio sp. INlla14]|uniref:DUF4132 domain-containing protein n=1 Tax=Butyrivibrio sp. INlla14 TaxID=1520808 RepID=UPI000876FF9B|nr:DUF4132 domain-containing protein [Butyrivibrio sp. INlla14]SCY48636.1 protein of unknown function [Butyrivibrio sp. INlla14]